MERERRERVRRSLRAFGARPSPPLAEDTSQERGDAHGSFLIRRCLLQAPLSSGAPLPSILEKRARSKNTCTTSRVVLILKIKKDFFALARPGFFDNFARRVQRISN